LFYEFVGLKFGSKRFVLVLRIGGHQDLIKARDVDRAVKSLEDEEGEAVPNFDKVVNGSPSLC